MRAGRLTRRTFGTLVALGCVAATAIAAVDWRPAHAPYAPRDPRLRTLPLFFYPAESRGPARAFVFFLGNDLGFWKAHQQLAERLARHGHAGGGLDVRRL